MIQISGQALGSHPPQVCSNDVRPRELRVKFQNPNARDLIVTIGFWGIAYHNYHGKTQDRVLAMMQASIYSYIPKHTPKFKPKWPQAPIRGSCDLWLPYVIVFCPPVPAESSLAKVTASAYSKE